MKIAIIGAGAIGGYVGVKLALAGEDLTFIVRGANLRAIRSAGMKLVMHDGSEHVASNVRATDSYDEAGIQDVVIVALKDQGLTTDTIPTTAIAVIVIAAFVTGVLAAVIPAWRATKHDILQAISTGL